MVEQLEIVEKAWRELKATELGGLKEVVDQTCAALDQIWMMDTSAQDAFPEARMRHLLEVCSAALAARVAAEFGNNNSNF